jgi:Rad3-related DNA helicase
MTLAAEKPLSWFPYKVRPHQDEAVEYAASVFSENIIGLLSAQCGVGKTIAVLSGYFSARAQDPDWEDGRLTILTRTHSQSDVFESELQILQKMMARKGRSLMTTSIVSRRHVCPMKDHMGDHSNSGFIRACAKLIRAKKNYCDYYWTFYSRDENGRASIKKKSLDIVEELLKKGIVNSDAAVSTGQKEGICPYELLRWCAKRSKIVIGPYGYLFIDQSRKAFLSSLGATLDSLDLIVDEAHNLADYVLDSESAFITGEDLVWLRNNQKSIQKLEIGWFSRAVDFLWEVMQFSLDKLQHGGEVVLDKWDVIPRFTDKTELENKLENAQMEVVDDVDGIHLSERSTERLVNFLYAGIKTVDSDDWHIVLESPKTWDSLLDINKVVLRIRPLNASGLTAPILWSVRSALLMSGTLQPLGHYAGLLGVLGKHTQMKDIQSPYPSNSQLILIDKNITTRYKERDQDTWRNIATRIRTALTTIPANKSALIAFPSYDMMNEVISHNLQETTDLGFRQSIVETHEAKIETLKKDLEKGPTAVFCVYGGKFSEGVDFVNKGSSMMNLIIGVGIPFSPPTSYQKALQQWYESRFGKGLGYYYAAVVPSVRRVAQLIGRLRRNPEDWGVCVLLDKRFQKYMNVLGETIVSQSWPYSDEVEMQQAMKMFLRLHNGGENDE